MQIDELIIKAESQGLVVNAIQYMNPYTMMARMTIGDYDLAFGPALLSPYVDTITYLAMGMASIQEGIVFHNDEEFSQIASDLENYLAAVETTPEVDLPALYDDMLDKLHDAEERLWEKQLFMPLGYTFDYWPGWVAAVNVYFNSQDDHVFENDDLRIAYSASIDRTVFVNYWALLPMTVYETFHWLSYSVYHDIELPNCVPT